MADFCGGMSACCTAGFFYLQVLCIQGLVSMEFDVVSTAAASVELQHTDIDASEHITTETEHNFKQSTAVDSRELTAEDLLSSSEQTVSLDSHEATLSSDSTTFQAESSSGISQLEAKPFSTVLQHHIMPAESGVTLKSIAVEVLTAKELSLPKAVPADLDLLHKAERELQHKAINIGSDVQNEVIHTDIVLDEKVQPLRDELSIQSIPYDTFSQQKAELQHKFVQNDNERIPTDNVLQHDTASTEEKAQPINDELRLQAMPADSLIQQKTEPGSTVLQNEALPDEDEDTIRDDIAIDSDGTVVECCESKVQLDSIKECDTNVGIVTDVSDRGEIDLLPTTAVETTAISLQGETDMVKEVGNMESELAAINNPLQSMHDDDDECPLDAVQDAELPDLRRQDSSIVLVDSAAVNTACDVPDIEDKAASADIDVYSSNKQLVDQQSNSFESTESDASQVASAGVTSDVVVRLVRLEPSISEMSFSDLSTNDLDSDATSSPENCFSNDNQLATDSSDPAKLAKTAEVDENESAALLNDERNGEGSELMTEDRRTASAFVDADGTLNSVSVSTEICDGASLLQQDSANCNSSPSHVNAVVDSSNAHTDGIAEDIDHVDMPKVSTIANGCQYVNGFNILIDFFQQT